MREVQEASYVGTRTTTSSIFCAAAWLGEVTERRPDNEHATIDRDTGYIRRPGSVLPLVRNIVVFLLQYAVAVVTAMKLNIGIDVAIAGQAISGACAGYFLGWTIALLRSYRAETAVAAAV